MPTTIPHGVYLTVQEAARVSGLSIARIRAACDGGEILGAIRLPGGPRVGLWLIPHEAFTAWLHNRRPPGRPRGARGARRL